MKNGLIATLVSLGVHGLLALSLAAYFRYAPGPDALATLDLSSVELSFAETENMAAAAATPVPTAVEPQPRRPEPHLEPPPVGSEPLHPRPADPGSPNLIEPTEDRPVMKTPEQRTVTPPVSRAEPPPASRTETAAPRQAKIDAPPRPKRTIRPDYPKEARQRGEQGEVTLQIQVGTDGSVKAVEVVGTSGFADLDAAAVKAARSARFTPAKSDGVPVESLARIKLSFKLR